MASCFTCKGYLVLQQQSKEHDKAIYFSFLLALLYSYDLF